VFANVALDCVHAGHEDCENRDSESNENEFVDSHYVKFKRA